MLIGVTALAFTGCEADIPRDPNRPAVVFGNDQFRDDGLDRPAGRAMDREKTAW
jgi:hypothetical protein